MILRNPIAVSLRPISKPHNVFLVPLTLTIPHRNYASKPSKPTTRVVPTLHTSTSTSPQPSANIPPPQPYRPRSTTPSTPSTPSQPSTSPTQPSPLQPSPAEETRVKDPARGVAAAQEFVKTGHLPREYKWAGTKQTALLVSVVLLIVLTPVLYGRVVLGRERKRLVLGPEEDGGKGGAVIVEEGENGTEGERGEGLVGMMGEGAQRELGRGESQLTIKDESVESRYREG
ncbi:hypothetical protein MBLNU457_4416t1 [Dothideomycetes sp. NU457]